MERAEGRRIAAIITPEIRKTGKRWGFKIIDIVTGSEEILSSVEIKPHVVGRYGININGMERIIDLFLESAEDAEYIFIDEIGPMELHSSKFREVIEKMLNFVTNAVINLMSLAQPATHPTESAANFVMNVAMIYESLATFPLFAIVTFLPTPLSFLLKKFSPPAAPLRVNVN